MADDDYNWMRPDDRDPVLRRDPARETLRGLAGGYLEAVLAIKTSEEPSGSRAYGLLVQARVIWRSALVVGLSGLYGIPQETAEERVDDCLPYQPERMTVRENLEGYVEDLLGP